MSEFNYNTTLDKPYNTTDNTTIEPRENVVAGIVGAFLFSLVGGILWFVLYLFGWISALSGIVGVICAIKGYSIFSKKESTKGIIIASIIAILVLALACYLCLSYEIFTVYKELYETGELDFYFTFSEAVMVTPEFLKEPEIASSYYRDLAIGLLFGILGAASHIISKVKKIKTNE